MLFGVFKWQCRISWNNVNSVFSRNYYWKLAPTTFNLAYRTLTILFRVFHFSKRKAVHNYSFVYSTSFLWTLCLTWRHSFAWFICHSWQETCLQLVFLSNTSTGWQLRVLKIEEGDIARISLKVITMIKRKYENYKVYNKLYTFPKQKNNWNPGSCGITMSDMVDSFGFYHLVILACV